MKTLKTTLVSLLSLIILIIISCGQEVELEAESKKPPKIVIIYDTIIQYDTIINTDTVTINDTVKVCDTLQAVWKHITRMDHFLGGDNFRFVFEHDDKKLYANWINCYPRPCNPDLFPPNQPPHISFSYQDGTKTYSDIDTLDSWINMESYFYGSSVNFQAKLKFLPPQGQSYGTRDIYIDYSGSINEAQ